MESHRRQVQTGIENFKRRERKDRRMERTQRDACHIYDTRNSESVGCQG
jgi:hypothetical protein